MADDIQGKKDTGGGSVRTEHVKKRIAAVAMDFALEQLTPQQRNFIDDLLLLERWVVGEVKGYANSITCHQLAKRLRSDFEAIEEELLPPVEIERRRAARQAGERRRHRYARGYRRAQAARIPPRIN